MEGLTISCLVVVDVHRLEILCSLMTSPRLSALRFSDPGDAGLWCQDTGGPGSGALTRPLLCNSQPVECAG